MFFLNHSVTFFTNLKRVRKKKEKRFFFYPHASSHVNEISLLLLLWLWWWRLCRLWRSRDPPPQPKLRHYSVLRGKRSHVTRRLHRFSFIERGESEIRSFAEGNPKKKEKKSFKQEVKKRKKRSVYVCVCVRVRASEKIK